MKSRFVAGLIGVCSLLADADEVCAAPEEVRLKATSNWLVDWADTSCALSRRFGPQDAPMLLTLRAYGRGSLSEITIAGAKISAFQRAAPITVGFGTAEPRKIQNPQYALSKEYGLAMIFRYPQLPAAGNAEEIGYPAPDPNWGGADAPIVIANGHETLVLEASGMKPALAALGKCADDLVTQWGLDPSVQGTLSRYPKPENLATWAARIQRRYPSDLVGEARLNVRVIVDEAGRPAECATVHVFKDVDFDEWTCRIIKESARFSPGLDAQGKPVRSFYTTTIAYRQ